MTLSQLYAIKNPEKQYPATLWKIDVPPKDFVCKQCGNCCLNLLDASSTYAHPQDIELWKRSGRDDILAWVVVIPTAGSPVYDLWTSPITGDEVERCPWLRKLPNKNKYVFRIHEVNPTIADSIRGPKNMARIRDAKVLIHKKKGN